MAWFIGWAFGLAVALVVVLGLHITGFWLPALLGFLCSFGGGEVGRAFHNRRYEP